MARILSFLVALTLAAVAALVLGTYTPPPQAERPAYPLPAGVAYSAAPPGQYGGLLVQSAAQEPKTFNPLVIEDAYSRAAVDLLQSGLTTYDPIREETVPALAASWEVSADNKSYTLHLRDILWSDGTPFTADDVIFTFDAVFDPRFPNRYKQQFTIAGQPLGYEKLDAHTVRFTTADIYAPFLNDIGFVDILPRHALQASFADGTLQQQWTSQTALDQPRSIVGSGPFVLYSYRPGERLVLAPNPHYWRADSAGRRLPYLDFLITRFVASTNTETVLFATGQTDVAEVSVTDIAWVSEAAATYDFTLYDRGPGSGISFIWFNQHPEKVPLPKRAWFQDRRFRQAVAHGLNRPGLIKAVYFGRGEPLDTIISPANRKWHNPDTRAYPYDPAKARELLQEAGFYYEQGRLLDAAGHPVAFELVTSEGSQRITQIATTFQENMRALGMDVKLSYIDFGTLIDKTSNTFDYDASMMGLTGGGDPSGGKAIYRSDGRLHVWYPSQPAPATPWEARIDTLVDQQERTLDEAERVRLIHEMQAIFSEELPLIFLITPNAYVGIKNHWRNVQIPALGSVLWNIDEWWTVRAAGED